MIRNTPALFPGTSHVSVLFSVKGINNFNTRMVHLVTSEAACEKGFEVLTLLNAKSYQFVFLSRCLGDNQ
jgi:hypothetical protein